MTYRKLRIAWSVACGFLCLLLIVLWVRSYWRLDVYSQPLLGDNFAAESLYGCIVLVWREDSAASASFRSRPTTYVRLASDIPGALFWFRIAKLPGGQMLILPMWFVIAATVSISLIPWLSWRFSLRTLLIGMTLVAIVCGLIVATSQ